MIGDKIIFQTTSIIEGEKFTFMEVGELKASSLRYLFRPSRLLIPKGRKHTVYIRIDTP